MPDLHIKLQERFPNDVVEIHAHRGDETVTIKRESLLRIMQFLKMDSQYAMNVLMDLTAVDGKDMKWDLRFEVVYHLYSLSLNHRLRVKIRVAEGDAIAPSLVPLWPAANWFEREVWDMFGIRFDGHPNLKRILMYEEFVGHPLRKDYPISKRQPLIGPRN